MRTVFALSSLAGLSLASFDSMVATLQNITASDRATQASIHALLSQLNGYGCWCFFDGEHQGKAKGIPIDEFDNACRTLNWGYQCAIFDDLPAECVPWESNYNAPTIIPTVFGQDFGVECGALNPTDSCAEHTCIVESIFISTVNSLIQQQAKVPDNDLRHAAGFEHQDNCPGFSHSGELDQDCCGDYENTRKPYNKGLDENGVASRACCNGQTFLTSLFVCCGPPVNAPQFSC